MNGINSGLALYSPEIDPNLYQNVDYKILPNPEVYDITKKDIPYIDQLELFLKNQADKFRWNETSWNNILD